MKAINLWKLVLAVCAVFAFSACNDNDGDDKDISGVAGTYNGYTSAAFSPAGSPIVKVTEDETVKVTVNDDKKTATVVLTSSLWGELKIENAVVVKSKQGYALTGTGKAEMAMPGSPAPAEEYDYTMTGTVLSAEEVSVAYSITGLMNGTVITFITGTPPQQ